MKTTKAIAGLVVSLIVLSTTAVYAQDSAPQTTPDGMELVSQTNSRVVYAMPNASLDRYTKVSLLDCYVAFKQDWQRDYNRGVSMRRRISADDMERIKTALADEFADIFSEVLTAAGYEVVDYAADDVLVIRPAIVNLQVTAPDTGTADYNRVIVRSAGEMTLFLELYDSTTSAIIARVTDARSAERGGGAAFQADRRTNRAEARKVITDWAEELASKLSDAREAATSAGE